MNNEYQLTTERFGGHFLLELPEVTIDQMVATFGPPQDEPSEPEKGYDHGEWYFASRDCVEKFNIYCRWGCFRIGGAQNPARFATWLKAALSQQKSS